MALLVDQVRTVVKVGAKDHKIVKTNSQADRKKAKVKSKNTAFSG